MDLTIFPNIGNGLRAAPGRQRPLARAGQDIRVRERPQDTNAAGGNFTAALQFPCMSLNQPRAWLTQMGVLASRPAAFVIYLVYALAWIVLGDGLKWHSIAVLATWGMTLVIQRAEHRDTQALHAKLDELLKVHGDAKDEVMNIDDQDAEEVERDRSRLKAS
jgi:low affinity Fe/Cu permease